MIPEVQVLALAGLLQAVQYLLVSVAANLELGPAKTMSPRDPQRLGKPLSEQASVGTGRLFRALNNHFEGLILFTLAVLALVLSDKTMGLTAALAWIYLAARILYVPAYYFGWVPWRSLIWAAGWLATVLMIILALI